MHRLARLSAAERDDLVADFLGSSFGSPDTGPMSRVLHRSLAPELPDDPRPSNWRPGWSWPNSRATPASAP